MRLAPVFAVLAVTLTGCGDGKGSNGPPQYPVPGCEGFDTSACDIASPVCQARLFSLAACLHGGDAGDMPPVTLMSSGDYEAYLQAQAAAATPDPNQPRYEQAYRMLGLVAEGDLDPQAQITQTVQVVAGFYEEATKTVHVIEGGTNSSPETRSPVLLHEFVHALQDREVDLASFHAQNDATYDSFLASDAVVEGEAQFQTQRYTASMLGLDPQGVDWDRYYAQGMQSAEAQLLQSTSPLTLAPHLYPYMWGSRYVRLGWAETGHSGVLDLFAAPPADTQLEMATQDLRREDVAGPAIDAPAPPENWTLLGQDVLGSLGVFEILGPKSEAATAEALALDWRADRLAVYGLADETTSPLATTLVWACDFANAESAASAVTLLARSVNDVRRAGSRVVAAQTNDGGSLDWAFESLLAE